MLQILHDNKIDSQILSVLLAWFLFKFLIVQNRKPTSLLVMYRAQLCFMYNTLSVRFPNSHNIF